jgi:predicted nuclease with TOPRIM domain
MKFIDYLKRYEEFDRKIGELQSGLEKLPNDVSPLVADTIKEQIKKIEKEKKKFEEQHLYDSDYVENERLWQNG